MSSGRTEEIVFFQNILSEFPGNFKIEKIPQRIGFDKFPAISNVRKRCTKFETLIILNP